MEFFIEFVDFELETERVLEIGLEYGDCKDALCLLEFLDLPLSFVSESAIYGINISAYLKSSIALAIKIQPGPTRFHLFLILNSRPLPIQNSKEDES